MKVKICVEMEYTVDDTIYATDVVEGITSAIRNKLSDVGADSVTVIAKENI